MTEGATDRPTTGPCCLDVIDAVSRGHTSCWEPMTRDELKKTDVHLQTALHIAARTGDPNALRFLCSAVPELREVASNIGESPLLIAAGVGNMAAVETILKGHQKEAAKLALHRDMNGTSALMAAVARGDNDMAFWLLKRFGKALAMLPNNVNMIPLHVAAAQGNIEFIRIATKYSNDMVNYRDEYGCTPCVYAVQGGCLGSVRYLVEKAKSEMGSVTNRGQSLLHIACLSGHEHIARWLLSRMGPDAALWATNDQANAIHCAAFAGSVPVLKLLLSSWSRRKTSQALTLRDSRGNTPLHLTAIHNHIDAALFLLDRGADPVLVNKAGHAAQAIATLRGHHEMAKLLAENSDLSTSKRRDKKTASRARSAHDLRVASPDSAVITTPIDFISVSATSPRPLSSRARDSRMASPLQHSSGYDSSGASEIGAEIGAADVVERRPMRYIEDDEVSETVSERLKNQEAQTDVDQLTEHIKVLDDRDWTAAVAQIDQVLAEVEHV